MSRPQNEILDDIILASGGTITSQTRNGKLRDWLDAVSQPATRFAPNFNGVSQYADFGSEISYIGDFSISVERKSLSSFDCIFSGIGFELLTGSSDDELIINSSSGFFQDAGFGVGNKITLSRASGVTTLSTPSKSQVVSFAIPATVNVKTIGFNSSGTGGADYANGVIYNYLDSLGNIYPMDDGWANNPVMRNTGTGSDGTFVNMTEAAWVEIPV